MNRETVTEVKRKQHICPICGVAIHSGNKIKSHGLTDSSYFKALQGNSPERVLGLRCAPGKIFDPYKYNTETYVICRKCDQKMGTWEEERERLFSSEKPPELFSNKSILLKGYSASKIKLACISDILRCSLFHTDLYRSVSIGPKHESRLINMVKEGNTGTPEDYTVILGAYNDPLLSKMSACPIRIRLSGINLYEVMPARGWYWWIKIDSRLDEKLSGYAVDSNPNGITIANFNSERLKNRLRKFAFDAIKNTD